MKRPTEGVENMAFKKTIKVIGIITDYNEEGRQPKRKETVSTRVGQAVAWVTPPNHRTWKIYQLPREVNTRLEAFELAAEMKQFSKEDQAFFRKLIAVEKGTDKPAPKT